MGEQRLTRGREGATKQMKGALEQNRQAYLHDTCGSTLHHRARCGCVGGMRCGGERQEWGQECKQDLLNLWRLNNEILMYPHGHSYHGYMRYTTQLILVAGILILLPQASFKPDI